MKRPDKRQQLILTALELFGQQGFHATGIDTILAKSGVAKKTLYNHFRSKDELIEAVLEHHSEVASRNFREKVEAAADTPRERLLAVFDLAEDWFSESDFYGCTFINAIGEHSDKNNSIRDVCKAYKLAISDYLHQLCVKGGFKEAQQLSDQLALLLEGATVTAQVSQRVDAGRIARQAAEVLIEQAS